MNQKVENSEALEIFDGIFLHPSLDIKNGVLVVGFRYRTKRNEEKESFVVANKGNIQIIKEDSFKIGETIYCLEKRGRKLSRIEEKWSINALQQFVQDYNGIRKTITGRDVFEQIVLLARRYIELEKDTDYYLLAAWILGTYFSPLFYAYPFLHIKAPKRSGKSQCLNFLMQLCFNATKARPSLAALSDTVDALRGTYLIDQADSLERKGNEELLDILADSYKKAGGKRRIINFDKRRGRETLEFETYGPKAFASIKELPEDLRDRCLTIPLIRSQKNFRDPDENNENWRDLRGKVYQILMTNYDLVDSVYSVKKVEYNNSQEILGRSLELWLPFEVVMECFGMREKISEAKNRFLAQYGFTEYEPSEVEEAIVKTVLALLLNVQEIVLTPKEISEAMDTNVFHPSATPKQMAARVGWAIKKFNLASEKKPRTKDGVRYLFNRQKVEGVYRSYFKGALEHTSSTPEQTRITNIEEFTV